MQQKLPKSRFSEISAPKALWTSRRLIDQHMEGYGILVDSMKTHWICFPIGHSKKYLFGFFVGTMTTELTKWERNAIWLYYEIQRFDSSFGALYYYYLICLEDFEVFPTTKRFWNICLLGKICHQTLWDNRRHHLNVLKITNFFCNSRR